MRLVTDRWEQVGLVTDQLVTSGFEHYPGIVLHSRTT